MENKECGRNAHRETRGMKERRGKPANEMGGQEDWAGKRRDKET